MGMLYDIDQVDKDGRPCGIWQDTGIHERYLPRYLKTQRKGEVYRAQNINWDRPTIYAYNGEWHELPPADEKKALSDLRKLKEADDDIIWKAAHDVVVFVQPAGPEHGDAPQKRVPHLMKCVDDTTDFWGFMNHKMLDYGPVDEGLIFSECHPSGRTMPREYWRALGRLSEHKAYPSLAEILKLPREPNHYGDGPRYIP